MTRRARLILFFAAALSLAGCGVTPVSDGSSSTQAELDHLAWRFPSSHQDCGRGHR